MAVGIVIKATAREVINMHINPGTERAIIRLSDNLPRLIDALTELSKLFRTAEPLMKEITRQLKSDSTMEGGEADED